MTIQHRNPPAVIYARFSPRPNAEECMSIETQLERCRAYCQANGYAVIGEHEDRELSGKRADNRPGLAAAIDQAKRRRAVLVVYALARLARNTRDAIAIAEELGRSGAQLASLNERLDTTNGIGRFFFTLVAALAELERAQVSERTSDAMRRHQANGKRVSAIPPYGWRSTPEQGLEPAPDEHAIIERIVADKLAGKGPRTIARELTQAGVLCRGGEWQHTTVKRILRRAGYFP